MTTSDATHWQLLESAEPSKQLLAIGALLFEVRNELRQLRAVSGSGVPLQAARPGSSPAAAAAVGAAAGYLAADVLAGPDIIAVDTGGFDLGSFF